MTSITDLDQLEPTDPTDPTEIVWVRKSNNSTLRLHARGDCRWLKAAETRTGKPPKPKDASLYPDWVERCGTCFTDGGEAGE